MKIILPIILFFLLVTIGSSQALFDTYNMLEGITVSLGNSTSCSPSSTNECDMAVVFFRIPQGTASQTFTVNMFGECFSNPPNATEVYNVTVFCIDGTSREVDLKPYSCSPANPTTPYQFQITTSDVGYSVINEKYYTNFWCSFRRNPANLDRLPTEFSVTVDSIILSTQTPSNSTKTSYSAFVSISNAINNIVSFNMQIWRILYIMLEIGAIFFALYVVFAMLPSLLRWVIEKVTS